MSSDKTDNKERYYDFSEEERVFEGYSTSETTEYWMKNLASGIQDGLSIKNPIVALKSLVANNTGTHAMQLRTISEMLLTIKRLLAINVIILLALVVVVFVNK